VDKTGGGKWGNRFMDNLEKASEDLSDLTEGDACKSLLASKKMLF
jgi:hypothetical protein